MHSLIKSTFRMHNHDTNLSVFQLWLFDNSLTAQKPLRNDTQKHKHLDKLFHKSKIIS